VNREGRSGEAGRAMRVLVVDDDEHFRFAMDKHLSASRHHVDCVASGPEALERLTQQPFDVVLLDLRMPGLSGLETLRQMRDAGRSCEVVVLTGAPDFDDCVEAMRLGAYHYLRKPLDPVLIEDTLRRAVERLRLRRENAAWRRLHGPGSWPSVVGDSPAIRRVLELVGQTAPQNARVILLGESGTGKGLIARLIHEKSPRRQHVFVDAACGAMAAELLESELFGHERGAFTGAVSEKPGLFELADGGTLFLDEFAEMSLEMQVKLLKVLDSGEFRRVGGVRPLSVDVRVLAATNRDVDDLMRSGRLREDLLHRLDVIRITLPPLRERREDIPRLVEHFLAVHERGGSDRKTVTLEAMRVLQRYPWPGNVREVANTIERLMILCPRRTIDVRDLPENVRVVRQEVVKGHPSLTLDDVERHHIERVLEGVRGNVSAAARQLGVHRNRLMRKLKQWSSDGEGRTKHG
jgi:DNA-binding NtrC family response regulator